MNIFKRLFSSAPPVDFAGLVKDGAMIIDVRTTDEFKGGHIKGAVNIPLDRLQLQIPDIKKKQKKVITCCRSGARSRMAKGMLEAAGVTCYNGGAWDELNERV